MGVTRLALAAFATAGAMFTNGQNWSDLVWIGQNWSHLVWIGQNWSHLVWIGQNWSHLVWIGQNWSVLVRIGHIWPELVRNHFIFHYKAGGTDEENLKVLIFLNELRCRHFGGKICEFSGAFWIYWGFKNVWNVSQKTVERSGIGSLVSGFLAPIPIACMHWLVGQLVTLSYCHSVGVSAPSRSICGPWDGWYVTVTYPQPELFPAEWCWRWCQGWNVNRGNKSSLDLLQCDVFSPSEEPTITIQ